ncbi:MAG: hypothetical protein RLZZ283_635, partial [Candidatus Parcubacteria bacterium]
MSSNNLRIVGLVVVIVCSVGVIAATNQCTSVPDAAPVPGSQGYRVWSGETLKSFEPVSYTHLT